MARFTVNFRSQTLEIATTMDVVIPRTDVPPPVLYLLHGLSDDHSIWLRRTSVERYAEESGVALVIPAVGRSFYSDMAAGPNYFSFVNAELPSVVHRYFKLGVGREKSFVAGLSMGGYGALKLGLSNPERFAAIGSFSGAVDIVRIIEDLKASDEPDAEKRLNEYRWIFGESLRVADTPHDLGFLASGIEPPVPDIYLACGAEDFLIEHNRGFRDRLQRLGIDFTYREEPGTHEWGFWDRHVRLFLEWLRDREMI